ncbi:MAG: hypothetical protein HWN81_13135 [Candidatus Lokiarchaeota archaeon]|nr:hypothetical protein [Candidatus Lokiarchaeota archaeon]
MSNADKIISLNITRFPQNLLIPGIDNSISIQAINNSSKIENFKFDFEGENLNIKIDPDNFKEITEFGPGDTKNIDLKLEPTSDGSGKITINVYWLQITEYTVKVQKVRDHIQESKLKKILEKNAFSVPKIGDLFNPDDFVIDMKKDVIKKAEQHLEKLREDYNSLQSSGSKNSELLEEIEKHLKHLAKGYLSVNNPLRGLELVLMLSKKKEQTDFYYNIIRAYGLKNLDSTLQIVNNLTDLNSKQQLLKFLAIDQANINPEQALKIGVLIQETSTKENLLINIYSKIIGSNPLLALKLIGLIEDDILKIKILFNIAKKLKERDIGSELVIVLNLIIEKLLKLLNTNYKKQNYKMFKDAITLVAEIEGPAKAHSIIENLPIQELKDKISKDIFNDIYVMVDEIRIKTESKLVFSQYFLLNIFSSIINNEIKNFCLTGGNISNNILTNDFNFNIAFLSLFGFDFSIFPILDRVYNDIKYSSKKSIAYYVFPSRLNYNDNELRTLKTSINQFFKNLKNASGQILIFNLDFIPYLGKPTVIVSDDSGLEQVFQSKVKKIGESINLIVDNSFFKGGKVSDYLKEIFPSNKCRIINIVLSYEFINDYGIFKTFIQSLL